MVMDTPNSLIQRGHLEKGKEVLKKIRGTDNVETEYMEIVEASRLAKEVKNPFRNLLLRRNRPQLVIAMLMQVLSSPPKLIFLVFTTTKSKHYRIYTFVLFDFYLIVIN